MKRIGIIGAGRFGSALAQSVARRGAEVLLLDADKDTVQRMAGLVAGAVQGDATDRDVLVKAGFQHCDSVVVAIGTRMEGSVLATMNLKEMEIPFVVAKASSEMHGKVLERVGADEVVYPNKERAERLARSLLAGSSLDYFEISDGVSVVEIKAPKKFVGKTLIETDMRRKYGLTVLAVKRAEDDNGKSENIVSPSGDVLISEGDKLVLFGPDNKLGSLS